MSDSTTETLCNKLATKFAPSISRAMLLQATAQAMGNAAHNATFVQQQQNMLINTNTALSTGLIHTIGAAYAKK